MDPTHQEALSLESSLNHNFETYTMIPFRAKSKLKAKQPLIAIPGNQIDKGV